MATCTHQDAIDYDVTRNGAEGCQDCLAMGASWVHLRMCQQCGRVGCCDSSPHRHATAHYAASGHPVIRSYEPGEAWFYCYADQLVFELENAPPATSHP